MVVNRILQASHIYYVSCWLLRNAHFHCLEHILRSYLWSKYGGALGLPFVPWKVCTFHKEECGLGLIDMETHGSILVATWVVKCLEGSSPWQVLMRHKLLLAHHVDKVKGEFSLCDIISAPHYFHIVGSFIFKSILSAWIQVASLVCSKLVGSRLGWDLANIPIWSWKIEGTCISHVSRFEARMLSKKKIFLWRNLWDFRSRSWKDWRPLAWEFSLYSTDRSTLKNIIGLIPHKELFKKNIDMLGPFWYDWEWCFGFPLNQYDSHGFYTILHNRQSLGRVLNFRWVASDKESWWIQRLHSVWSFRISYKLRVFAWLVIYQGLPSKPNLAKSGMSDILYPSCQKLVWSILCGNVHLRGFVGIKCNLG